MVDLIQAPATMPPGHRVYAIGDVHGCLERLVAMHELIAEDLMARPAENATLIHLGDYVDRGAAGARRHVHQPDGQPRAPDAQRDCLRRQ